MKLSENESLNISTILFVTVSGAIGVLASLPLELYNFLAKLQDKLTKVITGIGGFDHKEFFFFLTKTPFIYLFLKTIDGVHFQMKRKFLIAKIL